MAKQCLLQQKHRQKKQGKNCVLKIDFKITKENREINKNQEQVLFDKNTKFEINEKILQEKKSWFSTFLKIKVYITFTSHSIY